MQPPRRPQGDTDGLPRQVAVRIWDWSLWCRQVVRGIQSFAHDRPHWRLYVDAGQSGTPLMETGLALDGLLTHAADPRSILRVSANGKTKVALYSSSTHALLRALPRVRVDDLKVAQLIGRHFVSGGLRQLAYYAGVPRKPLDEDIRLASFEEFARDEGIPCIPFKAPDDKRLAPGVHMPSLLRWLDELPKPIGIAAWNIHFARWIVHACLGHGIDVPEQIAIVAWDDDPLIAETSEPTISAVALPAERLGFEAAGLLDKLMRGISTEPLITIDPSGVLNVRQSSDMGSLKDRDVYLALQFIREHATEPLKVPQIAKHLRISRKKLELDFTRVTGQTPYQAITKVRLEHAKRLLLETDWRTDRVARQSGIGTEPTLRRLLLEHEGMTPGEFRIRFGPI